MILLALAAPLAAAQEPGGGEASEIDELEPAVSSATLAGMGGTEEAEAAPPAVQADARRSVTASGVMDEIDLDRTEITGNQELPKVLYIVPWQKSQAGEIVGKPVNTLLEEVLAPVDRTEFIRQVDYYSDLYGEKDE